MFCGISHIGSNGAARGIPRSLFRTLLCLTAATTLAASSAAAKEVGIDGVMVYPDASGTAFVQFRDLLINGKLEFRGCGGPTLDKNSYKNLPKIATNGITSLERMPDGTFQAEFSGAPAKCVIPANFKFDKEGAMPVADLIDKMSFVALVAGSEPAGLAAFPLPARGAKLFFVSPADPELAQYLRATRVGSIAQWQLYLGLYASGPHTAAATQALETLLLADGQTELQAYRAAKQAPSRYPHLKAAQLRVNQLVAIHSSADDSQKLRTGVQAELTALCDTGHADLLAYRKALADHTKGYASLVAAREPADAALDIDPKFPAAIALHNDLGNETNAFEASIKTAQAALAAKHFDDAATAILRYASFVDEEPRLQAVRQAVYTAHMESAAKFETDTKWAEAVAEYEKADATASTPASKTALTSARASLAAAQDKAAADAALAKSQDYATAMDFIKAYEVLLALTDSQRKLVADAMKTLEPSYISNATDLARRLQQTHSPIQGRADEDAMRQAYTYLQRVDRLSDDPDVKVRLELLSDSISTYYVGLAKKYMDKPSGSGVGLGWSYLDEAAAYQPGLSTIRDERTKASSAYQVRSRLSVLVMFRDQTSRRESLGFAEQLQDSIATGLETSRLPVRVIRPSNGPGLDANYQLVGEILQHRTIQTITPETLKSNYRFNQREIPNPAWNKADQDYQDAQVALTKAQNDQRTAQAKNNKKLTDAADAAVDAAQKQVTAMRAASNAIPKTLQEDVIRPYTYTKRQIEITNIVELSFRIVDSTGAIVEDSLTVKKEVPRKFTVLENIKPDDTEGVHDIDAPPDQSQLMTDVEIAARDELVKLAHDKVVDLPNKVLQQARSRVKSQDNDAAAEAYILYLNCSTAKDVAERDEAAHFLVDNYNLRHAASITAALP